MVACSSNYFVELTHFLNTLFIKHINVIMEYFFWYFMPFALMLCADQQKRKDRLQGHIDLLSVLLCRILGASPSTWQPA